MTRRLKLGLGGAFVMLALAASWVLFMSRGGGWASSWSTPDELAPLDYRWTLTDATVDRLGTLDVRVGGVCLAARDITSFRVAQTLLLVEPSKERVPCDLSFPPPQSNLPRELSLRFHGGPVPSTASRLELSFVAWHQGGGRRIAFPITVTRAKP